MAPMSQPFETSDRNVAATVAGLSQQASTCNVLCLGIVNFEARGVAEQVLLKDHLNTQLAQAMRHVAPTDRIVLDTNDGIAINFLSRPEDAFLTAVLLRDAFARPHPAGVNTMVRIGLNCGPVRVVNDPKGRRGIVGDGINVARRVMQFADPGGVLVSRSFFENVSHIAEAHHDVFAYFGSRTDNNVRTHELYELTLRDSNHSQLEKITGVATAPQGEADDSLSSNDEQFEHTPPPPTTLLHNTRAAYVALSVAAACLLVAVVVTIQKLNRPAQRGEHPSVSSAWQPDVAFNKGVRAKPIPAPQPEVDMPEQSHNAAPRSFVNPVAEKAASMPNKRARNKDRGGNTGDTWDLPSTTFAVTPPSQVSNSSVSGIDTAAVVSLAVAPWGEVYVNGRKAGVSPPMDHVEVEPGMVHIEIRNSGAQSYSEVLQLAAGEQVRVKHKFPNP